MNCGRIREQSAARIQTERLTVSSVQAAAEFLPHTVAESGKPLDAVAACQQLLSRNAMIGVRISRVDAGVPAEVIGIGAAVFVSAETMCHIQRHPAPGAAERFLSSIGNGLALALDSSAIVALNAHEGLNAFVVLHHQKAGLAPADQVHVQRQLTAAFVDDMRGYRLREVIAEGAEDEMEWVLAGGFCIRNAYEDWYRTHERPLPRRVLVGMERNEAIAKPGTVPGLLFHYQPPQLGFTASQRRVLAEAAHHKTDAEIATVLRVSVSAVKKTWAAIFDQAREVLGDTENGNERDHAPSRRGTQKRHKLLAYLREHPEELKP
jgi:hypothetical protein